MYMYKAGLLCVTARFRTPLWKSLVTGLSVKLIMMHQNQKSGCIIRVYVTRSAKIKHVSATFFSVIALVLDMVTG